MKIKSFFSTVLLFSATVCFVPALSENTGVPIVAEAYSELACMDTNSEILRHLYRWYLDEDDFDKIAAGTFLKLYLLPRQRELDKGDKSLFADIFIPSLGVVVTMKKTDYFIEELNTHVRSGKFKIVNVKKTEKNGPVPEGAVKLKHRMRDVMEYLFRTRYQPDPPAPELRERLLAAIKDELASYTGNLPSDSFLTVFMAPLSPVANEVWAFWHDAKLLIHWSSDIDLNNPEVWETEHLHARIVDMEKQVILSFSEAPGSNAYMSRDHVGRVLYICTVLGEKLLIPRKKEGVE